MILEKKYCVVPTASETECNELLQNKSNTTEMKTFVNCN